MSKGLHSAEAQDCLCQVCSPPACTTVQHGVLQRICSLQARLQHPQQPQAGQGPCCRSGPAEVTAAAQYVGKAAMHRVLSDRDRVHLVELAWTHGFASWHAAKSIDAMWPYMRAKTRKRIEVRLTMHACWPTPVIMLHALPAGPARELQQLEHGPASPLLGQSCLQTPSAALAGHARLPALSAAAGAAHHLSTLLYTPHAMGATSQASA